MPQPSRPEQTESRRAVTGQAVFQRSVFEVQTGEIRSDREPQAAEARPDRNTRISSVVRPYGPVAATPAIQC
ncbi:MAG: hypothetical protein JO150_08810 [Acidobacteriaceae bacterium]|nr:hypothetical protein [Acidobacteriaceae bacterium]